MTYKLYLNIGNVVTRYEISLRSLSARRPWAPLPATTVASAPPARPTSTSRWKSKHLQLNYISSTIYIYGINVKILTKHQTLYFVNPTFNIIMDNLYHCFINSCHNNIYVCHCNVLIWGVWQIKHKTPLPCYHPDSIAPFNVFDVYINNKLIKTRISTETSEACKHFHVERSDPLPAVSWTKIITAKLQ